MPDEADRITPDQIQEALAAYFEQGRRNVRAMHPDPARVEAPEPFAPLHGYLKRRPELSLRDEHDEDETRYVRLDADDRAKLKKLLDMRAETLTWISQKNDKELKTLDGAVEFISSSRTAAKVLMYVSGVCVAFVGGVVALAKNGYDIFSMLRGGR